MRYIPAIVHFLQPNLSTSDEATGPSNSGRARKILPSHAVVPVETTVEIANSSQKCITCMMKTEIARDKIRRALKLRKAPWFSRY